MPSVTYIPPGPRAEVAVRLRTILDLISRFERLHQVGQQFGHEEIASHLAQGSLKNACNLLQDAVKDQAALCIVKVFEEPDATYDIIALRQVLRDIEARSLPISGNDPNILAESCRTLSPNHDLLRLREIQRARTIILWCRQAMNAENIRPTIRYLRQARDKLIAHAEAVEITNVDGICWDHVFQVVMIAKNVTLLLMNAFVFEDEHMLLAHPVAPAAIAEGDAFRNLLLHGIQPHN